MYQSFIDSPSIISICYDLQSHVLDVNYHQKGHSKYLRVPYVTYQRLISTKNTMRYIELNIIDKYTELQIN